MKCIYCKTEDQNKFKSVEHVFPQSFGVFGTETPTLKECVCDDCNQYFMKHLDQIIARESLEGITRYKKGMFSSESRVQQRLMVNLPDIPEMGENAGVLLWIDGQTGKIREPLPQVHFQVGDSGKYVAVKARNLEGLDWKGAGYSDKAMKVLAPSPDEYQRVLKMLKDIGIDFKEKSRLQNPFEGRGPDSQFEVQIEGTIDHAVKRALLKIVMNFAAKYIGVDEVLKTEWDRSRNYVRFDREPIPTRISQKAFWGEESNNLRFEDDSYNIRIENIGRDVIGMLQIFNLFTYEFKIIENYNIADGKEIAARFTPGKKPTFGVKGLK